MRSLKVFLILSSLLLTATRAVAGVADNPLGTRNPEERSAEKSNVLPGGSMVFGTSYNSLLYRIFIKFRDYEFSGLVLIKQMHADSSVHIVFLSEFGPTLMNLKYKDDSFTTVSAKEFFSNEKLIKLIGANFRMLIQDPTYIRKIKDRNIECRQLRKLKFRHLSDSFVYIYGNDGLLQRAKYRGNALTVIKAEFGFGQGAEPTSIRFSYRGVPLQVRMERVNVMN